jgi:hypothetical protein
VGVPAQADNWKEVSKMQKSQAEKGQMTYLEKFQPELVLEMQDLAVLAHVEEHLQEELEWTS